jgi:hypothetical protein
MLQNAKLILKYSKKKCEEVCTIFLFLFPVIDFLSDHSSLYSPFVWRKTRMNLICPARKRDGTCTVLYADEQVASIAKVSKMSAFKLLEDMCKVSVV